jgi:hypothetical protein
MLWLVLLNCLAAQSVTLSWTYPTNALPSLSRFLICADTNQSNARQLTTNILVRLDVGTNQSCLVTNLTSTWYFWAFAKGTNGLLSESSDVVSLLSPTPPPGLFILVPQYSATVLSTNWKDLGFFRVRIERP